MKKDIVWHALYDAMKEEQCPLCELVHGRILQRMEGFLYEEVNDVTIRDEICKSSGFCNYHSYMMMEMGDPLAHALIYSDLLKRVIDSADRTGSKQSNSSKSNNSCMFCRQAKHSETIYISAFIDAFNDDTFRKKYTKCGLLCAPHLIQIQRAQKKANGENPIKEITLSKYKELIEHLSEIKRKNDYRFSHEKWTKKEAAAWKKAVYIFNSKRGINGDLELK